MICCPSVFLWNAYRAHINVKYKNPQTLESIEKNKVLNQGNQKIQSKLYNLQLIQIVGKWKPIGGVFTVVLEFFKSYVDPKSKLIPDLNLVSQL